MGYRAAVDRARKAHRAGIPGFQPVKRRNGYTAAPPADCRFIVDGAGWRAVYCGRPTLADSSFCPHHHQICWMPPPAATRRPVSRDD